MKSVNGIARLNVPLHSGNGAMSVAKLPHQLIHMQAYLEVFSPALLGMLRCSALALVVPFIINGLQRRKSCITNYARRSHWMNYAPMLPDSLSLPLPFPLSLPPSVREHAPYGKQRPDIESHILFKWQNCQPIWQAIPNEPSRPSVEHNYCDIKCNYWIMWQRWLYSACSLNTTCSWIDLMQSFHNFATFQHQLSMLWTPRMTTAARTSEGTHYTVC